jgi:hypothetical protein
MAACDLSRRNTPSAADACGSLDLNLGLQLAPSHLLLRTERRRREGERLLILNCLLDLLLVAPWGRHGYCGGGRKQL